VRAAAPLAGAAGGPAAAFRGGLLLDASAAELAGRLVARARELVRGGDGPRAAVILRRALALAPGDAAAEALLREAERGDGAG
jgi:hypothetical protein